MTKTLIITWRDESYGQHSGAQAAFRLYDTVEFSDAQISRLHGAIRASGFTWCPTRCSWIAWSVDDARKLVGKLEKQGWTVEHAGRWTAVPEA